MRIASWHRRNYERVVSQLLVKADDEVRYPSAGELNNLVCKTFFWLEREC